MLENPLRLFVFLVSSLLFIRKHHPQISDWCACLAYLDVKGWRFNDGKSLEEWDRGLSHAGNLKFCDFISHYTQNKFIIYYYYYFILFLFLFLFLRCGIVIFEYLVY